MLNLIFLLLTLGFTAGVYLLFPTLVLWWLLPVVFGSFFAVILLFFVFLFITSLFLPKKKKIEKPNAFCTFMIRITMRWLMGVLGIRVRLVGRALLPEEPCVIVSNHRSDFDPMTMLGVLKGRSLAYISKEANFKIPIVGNYIYHAGFLPIDRGNGMRAVRTLHHAAEMMQELGVDIGIYPEGTRSKTGELLRFRPGAAVIAQNASAPIAVMVTRGTERIGKNVFRLRPTKVELRVVGVIPRETVKALEKEALTDQMRSMIEEGLKE